MNRPEVPCFQCKERCAGCHSKCEKYKSYRQNLDEFNSKLNKVLANELFGKCLTIDRCMRNKKKYGRN